MTDSTAHSHPTETVGLRPTPRSIPRGRIIHRQGRSIIPASTPANCDIVSLPTNADGVQSDSRHLVKMGLSGFVIGLVCSAVLISPHSSWTRYNSTQLLSFIHERLNPVPSALPTVKPSALATQSIPSLAKLQRGSTHSTTQGAREISVSPEIAKVVAAQNKTNEISSIRLAAFTVDHHRPRFEGVSVKSASAPKSPELLPALTAPLSPTAHRHTVHRVHSIIRKYAPKNQNPHVLADAIVRESRHQGYDPLFVAAVIKAESTFNPTARSHKGAQGLMQIMPATGNWLQSKNDIPRGKLTDPGHNLKLGIAYLKYLEREFQGNRIFTLVAYNWGPGHVQSAAGGKKRIPKECMTYALKILNDYQRWQSGLI